MAAANEPVREPLTPAPAEPAESLAEGGNRSLSVGRTGSVLGVVLLLGFVLSVASDDFLAVDNLLDVGRQSSLLGLMTLGVTICLISGQIDLSVAATLTLSGIVTAMLISNGYGVPLAVASGMGVGLVVGLLNGVLAAVLKIPSFIVTLGTLQIINGTSLLITDAQNQSVFDLDVPGLDVLAYVGQGSPLGIPMQLILLGAVAAVIGLVLRKSVFGLRLFAVGGNGRAADLAGVPVRRVRITAFVISGLLAAAAGIIGVGFISSVSPVGTQGQEFQVFAAAVIGGASLYGGYGGALGAVLGAFVIGILNNGLVLLAVSPFWQIVTTGVVAIAAVGLNRVLQRRTDEEE